jgi:hypothetical protein
MYGEALMDAQKEQSKKKRRRLALIVQEIDKYSGEEKEDVLEEHQEREEANEDKEPTLLQEAWQVISYLLPVFALVLIIALIFGHIEGWDIIQRCACCWWLPFDRHPRLD